MSHEHDHGHGHSHGHDHGHGDIIAEGKPLLSNRPIQIMVSSGILFIAGHILEYLSFDMTIVTIIYMIAALIAGYEIAVMAYNSLVKRHTIGPALLVVIACIASFIIGHGEEGAAVALLYYIAEFLEDYAELRAKRSIKSLVELAPETARVKVDDGEEVRNVDQVKIGEIVIIRPGDKVPLDGDIVYGTSSINQASITGESLPVTKTVGDEVFSGTVNEDGYLEMVVTKEAKDSVISKIVTLVKRSQLNRSTTETLVERISKYYTPLMIVISACVAFIPPLFFGQNLVDWVYKALSIMVISCPCAIAISVPLSYFSGIGKASKEGILVKGSDYLDALKDIKIICTDKTGTLTKGKFEVEKVVKFDETKTNKDILKLAALGESFSNHPISQSILEYVDENIDYQDDISNVKNYKEISGKGLSFEFENKNILVGNNELVEYKDDVTEVGTVIFIKEDENILGYILLSDTIKPEAKEFVANLKKEKIRVKMFTGDNLEIAKDVAEKIGISEVKAEMLPTEKYDELEKIIKSNKNGKVAFIGDGLNDSPVLARADIGISMGNIGQEAAIEASDVVIMTDRIEKIYDGIKISKKTSKIIKQNLIFAIGVKIIVLLLSTFGLAGMWQAIFADVGVTLLTILNTLRILK